MAGATIDHMISVTILISALLVAILMFNGLFASAIEYDRNRQIANKAVDLINTICLSPGNPPNWGETDDVVLGFGLQDPDESGYTLSPFSLMRLHNSEDELIEFSKRPGIMYNNLSANFGSGVFNSIDNCLRYDDVSRFFGINGEYAFRFDVNPSLDIEITQTSGDHLILEVDVSGSSLPLSGANMKYYLFHIDGGNIVTYPGTAVTDQFGHAEIDFGLIDDSNDAFSFVVFGELGGVTGVGYFAKNTVDGDLQYVVPLIEDFDNGEIVLAHAYDIFNDPGIQSEVNCDAAFFVLTSDFQFQEVEVDCPTDPLVFGVGNPPFILDIPSSEVGILVVSYIKPDLKAGSVIVPWGIGTLGVSVSFGSNIPSDGYGFVATEQRQVAISGISYLVKVSAWSLVG